MAHTLFIFDSTHDTIKAEKTLKKSGIECRIVPKPQHIQDKCGIAIAVAAEDVEHSRELLPATGLKDFELFILDD